MTQPRKKEKGKAVKPLPFPVYFWTVAVLAVVGLIDSIYLAISHYRVYTDIAYSSFCAISQSINCDTVSQSPYSILFDVPVPVWGIIGYTFFLLFLPLAWNKEAEKKRIWSLLFLVALIFSICSIILVLISTLEIHSHCIMCLLCHGINFMLLFYTWMTRKRFEGEEIIDELRHDISFLINKKRQTLSLFVPLTTGVVLVLLFFPVYWSFDPPTLSAYMPHGITAEGHPWVGAEHPQLEVVEFTDYQCFQCNKMHFFLRQLMAKYPDKIKLIHRHFPMDHEVNPIVKQPVHMGSGKLAMLTIYAATQNKFWQLSDILFSIARVKPEINIKELADEVGLNHENLARSIYDPKIQLMLRKDIIDGLKLGVVGTPSFVIDGKVYQGQIPPQIIKKIMN
ncbi:MAG: thioredoxin domain-containing protein [Desulfobacterales bacterium]|nr:MAG: thioredoxin domain-containing protein [Desulfobacterales bacterium]